MRFFLDVVEDEVDLTIFYTVVGVCILIYRWASESILNLSSSLY